MMMSSLAASHSENNNNYNNITISAISPITDKKETSSRTHLTLTKTNTSPSPQTAPAQPTISVPTKIPYPLTTFLTNKTNQFRRSTSLRMRDKNINLQLFNNTFRSGTRSGGMEGGLQMATEHGNNVENTLSKAQNETITSTDKITTATTTTIAKPEQQSHITHDFSATGRISPRRKLVLNPQNNFGSGLTRSLSLRRNYKYSSFKTDIPHQETRTGGAAVAALKDSHLPDRDAGRDEPDDCVNCVGSKTTHEILAKIEAEIGVPNELEKMSLNSSGNGAPRPATLTTTSSYGAGNTATSIKSAGSPNTPRTPTSGTPLQQHPHTYPHTRHSHTQVTKQFQLASVPETKLSPKTPPVTPDSPSAYLDDDLDSMYSFATTTSGRSTMSCEHPYVARNGTTFSGRKMKYVVHCSNYAGQVGPDYLTPTQRAAREIRRLKELLCVARQDLEQKDSEILRLTREVVELRLFKASLSSPEERSASSDAVTVREAELKTSQDVSPIVDMVDDTTKCSPRHMSNVAAAQHINYQHRHSGSPQNVMQLSSEMQNSFADSGHFEDMTSSSVHSKDSYGAAHTQDMACGSDEAGSGSGDANSIESYELQRQELIRMYEQRIEELIRSQDTASSEMKRSHNDKVEALLQKLAECNTRYADIVPNYEHAKERIRELEKQLEDLQRKLAEHEEKQNKMYLHMYQKGQEAERIARADQALELAHRAPNSKVSINELLHQLQNTQDELENIRTIYRRLLDAQKNRMHVDPEVTLQFLKSAIYYFLTDKENSQGHLQAIESILEYTETEKQNINKARTPK